MNYYANRRRVIRIAVLGFVATIPLVFLFMKLGKRLGNDQQLSDLKLMQHNGKTLIVAAFQETGYSEDDGPYQSGIELRTYTPGSEEVKEKLYVELYEDNPPPPPMLNIAPNGRIWVGQMKNTYASDTSRILCFRLNAEGKFEQEPVAALKGMRPQGFVSNDKLSLRNQYNEFMCLDLPTLQVREGNCPQENAQDSEAKSAFFLVRKTQESTRSRLYHFKGEVPPPPAQIRVGITTGDRPIDGTPIVQDLKQNYYSISEERLQYFRSVESTLKGKIAALNEKEFLLSPGIAWQNESYCIVRTDETGKNEFKLALMDATGKKYWTLVAPPVKADMYLSRLEVVFSEAETLLINPVGWIICMDNKAGKEKWRLIP